MVRASDVSQPFTPYTTVTPYVEAWPEWVDEEDKERIAAYDKYEEIYWSDPRSFKISRLGDSDENFLYVPNPRKIVDVTSHYFLKGLKVLPEDGDEESPLGKFQKAFFRREKFYSRFITAKHSGVTKGDFLFHLTANPNLPPGRRLSLTPLDPGSYFPIYDDDDLDKLIGVRIVTQVEDPDDPHQTRVKVLDYWYENLENQLMPTRKVWRAEAIWKMYGWNNPKEAKKLKDLIPKSPLPAEITTIPVYHFKNLDWQGNPFGSSELRGFESLALGVDQAVTDLSLGLALDGLGVYATDAGRPVDEDGNEVDWEVAPGRVLEVPGATMFKRVEGIQSASPTIDFAKFVQESLYEASSTSQVALGNVDVNVAESGIALAIQFMPTLAKLEQRDQNGLDVVNQMFYDWLWWVKVFEGQDFTSETIEAKLGDKLPVNRPKKIEELNNMLDRHVISRKFYRQEMSKLGYSFPTNIEEEIIEEQVKVKEAMMQFQQPQEEGEGGEKVPGPGGRLQGRGDTLPKPSNRSNNRNRPNESAGTEVRK